MLVRHGETEGQSSIRLHGATDVALSSLGLRQIERVAAALAGEPGFAAVLASPLQRSRVAAALVAGGQRPPPPVTVVPEFAEVDFGAWEGLTFEEVAARDPSGHGRYLAEGLAFTYPGGESRQAFWDRVQAGALRVLATPASPRVAAVLHKGVIKAVIAALTGMPHAEAIALPVSLAGVYRLRHRPDGRWDIHVQNATDHLGELDLGG
ncbi:probable phosphoglycerate mutase [Nannocystis exedens]|uniref:Probable phosphoglycerate mutase n=1 Tax=Nannocystis exedens TaxID=54 RepID=A0A1I1YR49_9BACT|nr:histidine phosphatase family protein [Nannocystis exedens]PCC70278.1 phosphoglycerate mutase [Nannocystis exedens]SFE20643.1 probable phosphoglycerate mutase [Nannocystis exedens]